MPSGSLTFDLIGRSNQSLAFVCGQQNTPAATEFYLESPILTLLFTGGTVLR